MRTALRLSVKVKVWNVGNNSPGLIFAESSSGRLAGPTGVGCGLHCNSWRGLAADQYDGEPGEQRCGPGPVVVAPPGLTILEFY